MNNIIEFPKSKNEKILEAIGCFSHDNADIALKKFLILIDDECYEASAFVGAIHEYGGKGINCDYTKAKFYYEQSVEKFGAVEGYLGLIRIYYHGLGIEVNYCKVLELCETLTEDSNNQYALFIMGKMNLFGYCVSRNFIKAEEYFTKAWNKGYVFGLTYLGILEQYKGNKFKGFILKMKAGFSAYMIGRKNINDPRIREI